MTTFPLPAYSLSRMSPSLATEQNQEGEGSKRELKGLIFIAKSHPEASTEGEDDDMVQKEDRPLEAIRAVLVYDEQSELLQ